MGKRTRRKLLLVDDDSSFLRDAELILSKEFECVTVEKPEEELFDIVDVPAAFPEYAPIVESETCEVCGEQFMGTKKAAGDNPVCLACAGADCMAVLGRGVCVLKKGVFSS